MGFVINLIKKLRTFFYYQRAILYDYDLSVHHDAEVRTNLKLCVASLKDIELLYHDDLNTDLTSIDWKIWKEKISNSLWKGFICKDGDAIVAQAFYSKEDIFFGGTKWVVLNLPPNSVYAFKYYVRPDYRGKKIGQAIESLRVNNAKKEALSYFSVINSDNKVSRHIAEKNGYYVIGSVIFLKCRFFNKVILSPSILKRGFRIKKISNY